MFHLRHVEDCIILEFECMVFFQLLYTGMLETTKIRREGFAVRPMFEEFVNK